MPSPSQRAQLELHEQVLSLTSAGRYTAVLTADRLDIYDQNLELYASLTGTQGARQVMQRSDGSALLLRGPPHGSALPPPPGPPCQ